MKFSLIIAIVDNTLEHEAVDIAKANGAGGVTLMKGVGIGLDEKKTFFGLTYERSETILFFVTEKRISVKVMKALKKELDLDNSGKGMVMIIPIEHMAGLAMQQLRVFEDNLMKENEI